MAKMRLPSALRPRRSTLTVVAVTAAALTLAGCGSDDGGNPLCGAAYNPENGRNTDFAMGMGVPGTGPKPSDDMMSTPDDAGMTPTETEDGGMTALEDGGVDPGDAGADPGDAGANDDALATTTQAQQISAAAMLGLQVNAFLDTSTALVKAAKEMDTELLGVCQNMAKDLNINAAELAPAEGKSATEAACVKVFDVVKLTIETNLTAGARLSIVAEPPRCELDAAFTHTCIETCEQREVTETEVRCKPGKLSGECSATCSGQCSGQCSAGCTGECTGTCTGQCSGTCQGQCDGTCSLMNAKGECIGQCEGTCTGSCSATCTGSCSATCNASCGGSCTGSCRGGCSVGFTAPKCEEIEVTKEVTKCSSSCETEARAQATCTPPALSVNFAANLSVDQEARLNVVVASLRQYLPTLYKLSFRAGTVVKASAEAYTSQLNGFVSAGLNLGSQTVTAAACLASAAEATVKAMAQVVMVANVSVNVSASVSAEGKAQVL